MSLLQDLSTKARGEALSIPAVDWKRIDEGASPLRVVRDYRALTQIELARRSGFKPSHISAIETGRRAGTIQMLIALAKALRVPLGVLAGEYVGGGKQSLATGIWRYATGIWRLYIFSGAVIWSARSR